MKKTLILILVVLMALFAVSVITAQTEEPVQTDPAAAVTEPAAEGAEPTSDQPAAEEKQPEEQPAAEEEQPQEESNPETPAETPDVTEEGGDTPSDTPAATEENVETPTEAPAAAEENVETPTNTPDVTEEGSDTPTDTPDVTEENVETPTDTPAATEGTDETPANTPEVTDTPDPDETAAPETTAPAPAEDEDSVIYMTVTIAGTQLTVKYDENDTNTYTAEGFTVLSVDCTNEKGETVACPSFNEKKDLIFDGSDRAELPGNKCDKANMGLSEDQFSLDLKAENVEVSFVVIDGYVEVVEDYTEPEVIDQTGTDEPEEEPEETPEETEPEDKDQETEKPAEEASDDVIVYSSSCMTLRLIKKPAEPVEEPAGEPAAEPAAAAAEGEEENADELNENEEELNNEGEDQNGDDLNNDAEDLKDEDEKENAEEQNEDDENEQNEEDEEKDAEDQDNDEEGLKDEDKKENAEEQNENDENDENEQNEEDEEKDAEDTDKDGFHTIVSGDGSAAGMIPEITDPAAGEGENTEAGEGTAEDTAPKSIALTEDMVIFTAADAESEALAFTFEEGMKLTVLSVDENGWAAVEFPDGTQGYVQMPAEEEQPETEPGTETEADETPMSIALTADMVIFTAADAESEALAFTFEEGMKLTVLSVDENGWAAVEFSDGTQGYILMPAAEEQPETEPETETAEGTEAVDDTPKTIALTEDMMVFTAADAESEALAFTFEEGMKLTILSVDENGWAAVEFPDGTLGYIQMPAQADEETEETDETPKSILLTADMVIFTAADAESEALAFTFEEGMKLTILSVDENGWATVEFPDGTLGYIQMPAEEPEEADDTPKSILLTADMVIFTAADAESEAIPFTFEEGIELTVISFDPETGWALVELPDGTRGYVQMPVEKEPVTATVSAATNIRFAANGQSVIILTPEEDMEVIILDIEGDWVKVKLPDGRTGYIFIDDIEFEGKPEKVYIDKKVTIFSDRRPEMAEGETITLTSKLEGFEDCEVIIYQWECDKGNGFEDIEGANSESFSYQISKETLPWSWCLTVYYK